MMYGITLTSTPDITQFQDYLYKKDFNTVKVVPTWGWSWDDKSRGMMCAIQNTVVRTACGDPSNNTKLLLPEYIREEIDPWYAIKRDIFIELGNEPNIKIYSDAHIWTYRYWLQESIRECRKRYPYATLIAPAMIINDHRTRWYEIMSDVMNLCDYIGMHAYEDVSFKKEQTHHIDIVLREMKRFTKPMILTELGIYKPSKMRETEYREMAHVYNTIIFHYDKIGNDTYHSERIT